MSLLLFNDFNVYTIKYFQCILTISLFNKRDIGVVLPGSVMFGFKLDSEIKINRPTAVLQFL